MIRKTINLLSKIATLSNSIFRKDIKFSITETCSKKQYNFNSKVCTPDYINCSVRNRQLICPKCGSDIRTII